MEDVTDLDYNHAKNFRKMCFKIYGLDPEKFLSSPR